MCFRSRRAAATTIRRATTTTTMRTRTTTTTLRGTAAIWLFLLTFMSMQRHRLSGDCCYGAALLMQQQMPQKQQTLQQQQQIQQYHHHHLHHQSSGVFRDQEQDQDEAGSRQAINSDASASTSPGSPMSPSTAPSLPPPLPSTATTPSTATPTSAPMRPGPSGPSDEAVGFGGPAAVEWPPEDAGPEGGGGGGADDAVRVARAPPEGSLALQADDPDGRRRLAHDDPIHALSRLLQEQKQARPRPRDWGQEGEAGAGAGAAVEAEGALPGRRHVVREKLQFTPELSLKQGRVVGIVRRMQPQTGLRDVDQFLGLPYAEAPVGSRRFMPPGTPLPWQGLKMARHLPPVCPQKLPDPLGQSMSRGRHKQLTRLLPYLRTESEDCLYLNVYVPRGDGLEQAHLYPVLVYIHGESFEWNSGNPYDGSVLASYGELIVVTVNYRLGVLGFLKPGISENTVANFGLLDQIAALHWIKENIGSFGGDRDRVTLMGHGTGAACVNYLMVSPVASGLFHRAILMSGSAMSDWAAANHSLQLTMQLAHSLDCPLNDDNEEMLDCLRAKRYEDILKISTAFPQFSTSLGPIVDGHVIPNQPYKVMGQYTELFSRYDLLFGVTESESYYTLDARDLEEGLREDERDNLLRFYMQSRFDVRPDLALAATLKKYIDMYNNPIRATNTEHRDVVLDILSDARVVGPLMQTGLFHADVNPHNYMYVFGHNSAAGPHASLPHSIVGEELAFIFGAPLAPAGPFHNSYTKHEKLLSEAVMAYWSNFAKTGNPKAPWKGTFINLHAMEWDRYDLDWPEFNKRTQAYINIGIPPSIGYKYRQVYMNFWNKELPDELNQIAAIQQQPFLLHHQQQPSPASLPGFLGPRGGTAPSLPPPRRGGEVITGHMSQFGSRDNAAEDPVRTLKLLLQEPPYGAQGPASAPPPDTAENMYNAPPTFGQAYAGTTSTARAHERETEAVPGLGPGGGEKEVARSETTLQLLIGLIVVFIVLNVAIYSTFLLQKKRKKQQSATSATAASQMMRKLGAGGILSYDGATDDELKRSKPVGDGDDSFVLDIVRKSNKYEPVTKAAMTMTMTTTTTADRSPIHGFQMQRQLSCSTVDTHTKVCEWMAGGGGLATAPAAPRGARSSQRTATTMSSSSFSSRGGSGSGSRGGGGSSGAGSFLPRPRQVNVAVDATPQARGQSVLGQEPIEGARLAKGGQIIICQEVEVADQELLAPQDSLDSAGYRRQLSAATEPCGGGDEDEFAPPQQLVIAHQHSRSDPVEMPYSRRARARDHEQVTSFIDLNVNVTSRSDDDDDEQGGGGCVRTPAEQLSLIKRRNYPKVLPTAGGGARAADSSPMTLDLGSTRYKRNSLPPNGLVQQLLQLGPQPPMPPPRTISTLGRRPSHRRGSAVLTTSPVRLAQDCTVDEEDEEPAPIAQNTLIVGPIVPKADFSTLRRARRPEGMAGETRPPPAHHTEAVYAIEAPGSGSGPAPGASAAAPLTPITPTTPLSPANFSTAPNTPSPGDIYAVPHKGAARLGAPGGRSNIPRILPGTLGQDPATAPSAAASTTALPTTSTSAGHDTTAATAVAASSTPGVSSSSSTASRIPQLSRGPNALQQHNHHQQQPQQDQQHSHQQQQQPLGHQQHLQHSPTNQDESGAAADAPGAAGGGAATTTPAAATALSTPLTTTTTNSAATAATTTTPSASAAAPPRTCGSSPGVPAVPSSASLDSASSSSTSSACSSSPSSTGTVRTELKQRKK